MQAKIADHVNHSVATTPREYRQGISKSEIARTLNIGRTSVYRLLAKRNPNLRSLAKTTRRKSLTDLYGAEVGGEIWDRFTVHYTPTHGSWLNQAEIEIGNFSRQCLGTRRIPDLKTLLEKAEPGIVG